MNINPVFNHVVGQETAKVRLSQSIASAVNGGEMNSPLLTAEAGVGKSHLARAAIQGYKDAGFDTLTFNSPAEFREKGEAFSSFISLLMDSPKYAIFIDEAHEINGSQGQAATVQLAKVRSFLMKALDKGNEGREIRLDSELVVNFSRKKGSIILATNFPHMLDKSGAFQSRCDHIPLDLYNENELIQILQGMLVKEGFQTANENTLAMIARCGRGTARPLEKIVGQLKIQLSAEGKKKHTINREDVISALKLSKMFPRGIKGWEIDVIKLCHGRALRDGHITSLLPHVEPEALRKSKGYLIEGCKLMQATTHGIMTTTLGSRYVDTLKNEGFLAA